jgi:hypothetical protein
MTRKTGRPAARGRADRAGDSKGLGGNFDPHTTEQTGELQDSEVPIAQTRIVIGCRYSFVYIPHCPLCGLEHMHDQFPLHGQHSNPLQAFLACGGHRASHCFCQGPGRIARFFCGEWRTVFVCPPEWREPEGQSYRLAQGPEPACFTPRGIKSKAAHCAMAALARRGIPTSLEILRPRRPFVLWRGDK